MPAAQRSDSMSRRAFGPISIIGAVAAAGVVVSCVATFWLVAWATDERRELLLGTVSGSQIQLAAIVIGAVAVATAMALGTWGWWRFLAIPPGAIAVVAVVGWLLIVPFTNMTVTSLMWNGCETGYIAREQGSGADAVYRQNGVFITRVAQVGGDDFFEPLARGAYVVEREGDLLHVWYNQGSPAAPLTTDEANFILPATSDRIRCP